MITKHEIVATINEALTYFSSLSPKEVETLNKNLGLSNLGLNPTETRFSEYLDILVLELLAAKDDWRFSVPFDDWNVDYWYSDSTAIFFGKLEFASNPNIDVEICPSIGEGQQWYSLSSLISATLFLKSSIIDGIYAPPCGCRF